MIDTVLKVKKYPVVDIAQCN